MTLSNRIKKLIWGKGKTRIQILRDTNHNWFWRAKAGNNEILCHSEAYASKQMALKGLSAAKKAFEEYNVETL